ncbi:hypothetical protein AOL_s00210g166 [Orbilia oligospora ATCC 24927]|uniref:Uncharacterized protein n=1 Tax=Arthrobotrys oligospora (strain ATCC 24927 / CBS 115.81 / DSM 1491) TaxID=756982 RepID=G1XS08_ARTOA|nr:hypothetical protein AOL_s00210g166 [Orbilia oligospora ATCC 24927]EGX44005.1 hypothetical protein AOL_s00210g166 [Orbilia oligospora ATCC 24927]
MHLQVFSRYCLFIFTFPTFFSFGYGLLPVRCDESTLPPENLGLTSTKFTRNLDNYLEILSTTAVFRNFKNSISEDMKFLHVFLSYIYHPNSLGPRSTLPVAALANLYRLIVGLKLHCFESAFHLAKTLIQVDEAEAYVPVPLPDSDSTADTNPLWMEDEEPNSARRFQYINDNIATNIIGRLGTLIYQYDQILLFAVDGWTPEQIFSIRKFRAAYEAFRNDTVTITNKSKYAGLNLNMRQRELSREELKAMVDDPAAVY